MKIGSIKEDYYEATAKLSEIVRQFDFAGVAIIWLFRVGKDTGGITYSNILLIPLGFFVASLTSDLAQYTYKSVLLGALNTYYWRIHKNEVTEVHYSGKLNWPTIFFFWAKIIFTVLAYLILSIYILYQFCYGQTL